MKKSLAQVVQIVTAAASGVHRQGGEVTKAMQTAQIFSAVARTPAQSRSPNGKLRLTYSHFAGHLEVRHKRIVYNPSQISHTPVTGSLVIIDAKIAIYI